MWQCLFKRMSLTSSGSVIAASGHSSNGVNVVIWETLAPPTTSRASIISHEGIFLVLFPSKTLKHGKSDGCFDSCHQVSRDIQ
ncbi:hypothetical protein EZV62_010041 [Acer yangbiense]|uniref:Uncharacterized protein n=1 Tax=Acer yangbiense TaxID=1000413 RepID=A0A5C7I1A7_9ROSI|nr:hypothetical protein EZV62_010041 [Acer yangbiense]